MKKLFVLSLLCAIPFYGNSQNATAVSQLDIKNFSGEILNIVKDECVVRKIPLQSSQSQILLSDSVARNRYLLQFEQQASLTIKITLPTEFVYSIERSKLEPFGDDALSRFKTGSAGRYVDNLLTPVISGGVRNFLKDTIQVFLRANDAQISAVTSMIAGRFLKNNFDIKNYSEDAIRAEVFQLLTQTVPIELHRVIVEQISNKLIYYKSHSEQLVLTQVRRLRTLENQFNDLEAKLDTAATVTFRNLGKDIKVLADNEDIVNNYISALQNDIQARSTKIRNLENTIVRLSSSASGVVPDLIDAKLQHAKLVAQNVFQTDVVNNYLRTGLSMIGRIDDIKQKAQQFFSAGELDKFKKQLDAFKAPTLSSVVSFASMTTGTVEQIGATMQSLGILKGGAAQTVGKFVKYANLAISIATSIAPPNPIGLISALGSLGGLFGGGGPTLEEQMFEAMNNGFKQINERLDQIDQKIDRLTEFVQQMYKEIMQSLNSISGQLALLQEKIELQNQMTSFFLYQDYNLVEEMIKSQIDNPIHGLKYYDIWYNVSTRNNIDALHSLSQFVSSPNNLKKVVRESFTAIGATRSIQQIAAYDINAFKQTLALFRVLNPQIEQDNKAKNLLLMPSKQNTFFTNVDGLQIVPDIACVNFDADVEDYINPVFLSKIASQFITLHPFFIISRKDDPNFKPVQTLEELVEMQEIVHDRLDADKRTLGYLLDRINESLVQQAIFSGYSMMPDMNNAIYQNGPGQKETIAALTSNELLAKNFCCFLINSKIDQEDIPKFEKIYYDVITDHTKVADLNSLLRYASGHLRFGFNDDNANDPLLYLNLINPTTSAILVHMPVPDMNVIESERMQYSDSYYGLLRAKEGVMDAMVDFGFFNKLTESQKNQYKDIFLMNKVN